MVSLFGILNVGSRGLAAAQAALNTTGNNISNVDTEGYSRQRVVQQTTNPLITTNGALGQGVDISTIERIRDTLLDGQINTATSDYYYNQTMDETLSKIESFLSDPLTSISDTSNSSSTGGINNLLSQFFDAFNELSNTPEAPEVRSAALESARALAETFSRIDSDFDQLTSDLNEQVGYYAEQINSITNEIASLNQRISSVENGKQVQANDYRDQRDQLINQLSEIIPVDVVDNGDGTINVSIAGQGLVNETAVTPLQVETNESDGTVSLRVGKSGLHVIDDEIRSGKLGAILQARDETIPSLQDQMDELARGVIYEVNKIQSASSGIEGYEIVSSHFDFPEGADDADSLITLDRIFNNPTTSDRQELANSPYPIQDGTFTIRVGDSDNETEGTFDVNVSTEDTLTDLVERIDRSDGVVQTASSALEFDPVYVEKVNAQKGLSATELTGPLSQSAVAAGTPIAENGGDYTLDVYLRNSAGATVDSDPSTSTIDPYTITINSNMSLADVATAIETGTNGKIRANLVPNDQNSTETVLQLSAIETGATFSIQNDTSGLIQAFDFPMTDPSLPLTGGDTTTAMTTFSGQATDSLLGTGSPSFNTVYNDPSPTVIASGTFELVVVDNNNVPTVHTVTVGTGGIETLEDLQSTIQGFDSNLTVSITSDNQFIIQADNNRSFFFQNDTTGLVDAMGFSDINGYGKIGDQPFQDGSFEILVANEEGTVTHIVEVPVIADPSKVGGILTLNDLVDQINESLGNAGAPLRASIVADPQDSTKNQLQIEAQDGYEFTFRSDDSLLLSALGFTDGPVLDETLDNPILSGQKTVALGDSIGPIVRAKIVNGNEIQISTNSDQQITFTGDTSNFLAAAGINALFTGTGAGNMEVNSDLLDNPNLLAASADGTVGNNEAALAIANLEDQPVLNNMTLGEHYRSTISQLGNEGSRIAQSLSTSEGVLSELSTLQEQQAGVSLDEESINIIRFQQAYQAAAQFISVVDELLDVVINQLGA